MTLGNFINEARTRLEKELGPGEAKAIAFRLVEHYLDIPSYKYISDPETEIESESVMEALSQIEKGRPLQYVIGHTQFCELNFKVSEGCLIPRPETEELVYRIVDENEEIETGDEPFNILDMCTGSGCIAFSLAKAFPEAAVFGCDNSNEALSIACKQKVKLEGARPVLFWADILSEPPVGLPHFDIIVSNPPYIMEKERKDMHRNVLEYEPVQALFVPDDDPLIYYRAIKRWGDRMLKAGGKIYLEINEKLAAQTAELFPGAEIFRDVNGKERFVRYIGGLKESS